MYRYKSRNRSRKQSSTRRSKRRSRKYRQPGSGYAPVQYDLGVCKRIKKDRYSIQTGTNTWEPVGDISDCRLPKAPQVFISCNDPDGPTMNAGEMRVIAKALGIPDISSSNFSICDQVNLILSRNSNKKLVKSLRPSIPKLAELWFKYRKLGQIPDLVKVMVGRSIIASGRKVPGDYTEIDNILRQLVAQMNFCARVAKSYKTECKRVFTHFKDYLYNYTEGVRKRKLTQQEKDEIDGMYSDLIKNTKMRSKLIKQGLYLDPGENRIYAMENPDASCVEAQGLYGSCNSVLLQGIGAPKKLVQDQKYPVDVKRSFLSKKPVFSLSKIMRPVTAPTDQKILEKYYV